MSCTIVYSLKKLSWADGSLELSELVVAVPELKDHDLALKVGDCGQQRWENGT